MKLYLQMTYRECIFFIGRCLTLGYEPYSEKWVVNYLESKEVDWDYILKISSEQYVHLAFFSNLKRAGLLHYLPKDLVEYLSLMIPLNRERNEQIMVQVEAIDSLLKKNAITPVFLKGVGFLFEGMYKDNAERIISDIDFLVPRNDFENTISLLIDDGYSEVIDYGVDTTIIGRHFGRMSKKDCVSPIEIHYKMVSGKYEKSFNYQSIKDQVKETSRGVFILSQKDQIVMTCFNKQINDHGHWNKRFFLRSGYDLFLLSKRTTTIEAIEGFNGHKQNVLNSFLRSSKPIFSNSLTIEYKRSYSSAFFLLVQNYLSKHHKIRLYYGWFWDKLFIGQRKLKLIAKAPCNRDHRVYLSKKISNRLFQR